MTDLFSQNPKHSGRGLDTVSHLFLSSSGPSHGQKKPETRSASKETESPSLFSRQDAMNDSGKAACAFGTAPSNLCIVLCPEGFAPRGSFLVCTLALALARNHVSVGLIETTAKLPHTFFLSGGYENINAIFWERDPGSAQFEKMLSRLQQTCDIVLMNIGPNGCPDTLGPLMRRSQCLILTTSDPEELLKAYGVMKKASQEWACEEIGLVIFEEGPAKKAEGAFRVMAEMARKFLWCTVSLLGSVYVEGDLPAMPSSLSAPLLQELLQTTAASIEEVARNLVKNRPLVR
jgi:hypothetical protein